MRVWRLVSLALVGCLLASVAMAQRKAPDGLWAPVGERACGDRHWAWTLTAGRANEPDPYLCTASTSGMTAICTGNYCRYKNVTPDQCRGDGERGKAYQCRASAAARQTPCAMRASAPWTAAGKGYSLTMAIDGPTCASATATITVRRPDGLPIWSLPIVVRDSAMFENADTPQALNRALTQRLKLAVDETATSDAFLQEWREGEPYPKGRAPQFPARDVSRMQWNEWRAAKLPLLLFVPEREAVRMYILEKDGRIVEVGKYVPS